MNIATENFNLAILNLPERATVIVLRGFFFFCFFLNVAFYDGMDFVFDGTSEPRALHVLPHPWRRAEVQKSGHVTQGTQVIRDNPPASHGDSHSQQQEVVETNTLICRQTLGIKEEYEVT